ncbi:MAG: hypothetical protein AB7D35_09595, partial [Bacteroidales bacterium]
QTFPGQFLQQIWKLFIQPGFTFYASENTLGVKFIKGHIIIMLNNSDIMKTVFFKCFLVEAFLWEHTLVSLLTEIESRRDDIMVE